jgi:hypothetical protein
MWFEGCVCLRSKVGTCVILIKDVSTEHVYRRYLYSMKQGSPSEADRQSPCLLKPQGHLFQSTPYSFNNTFNITLPSTPRSAKWSLSFGCANKNFIRKTFLLANKILFCSYGKTWMWKYATRTEMRTFQVQGVIISSDKGAERRLTCGYQAGRWRLALPACLLVCNV